MTRMPALIPIVLLTGVICASAQEAPPPEPTHEKSTLAAEPRPVTYVADFVGRYLGGGHGDAKPGFYPAFGSIVSGAGWISIGPGYRQRLLGNRAIVDASAAISLRAYKLAQTRFEFTDLANSRVAVGAQLEWQDLTQLNYFGNGPESPSDARSQYRLKTTDLVGYGAYRPTRWLTVAANGGRLDSPTLAAATGPLNRDYPDAREAFPADQALALARQPSFAHARLSFESDTRDYPDHPSRGGLYTAAWSRYRDLDLDAFSFTRYEMEGAHFLPFLTDGLVVALRGWTVMSDTSDGQSVPLYLMPSLGGNNTLRAFPNYRFHDRNLVMASAEARLALTMHIDTVAFADAGGVAPQVERLRLDNTSYGIGLRLHTHEATTMRFDVAHGREGWHVFFSVSDPFRLRRLERHTAPIPFAP